MRRRDDLPLRRYRRGMFLLPSLFTSFNILLGFYAILQSTQATVTDIWHFDNAAKAIGLAILADGLDGAVARMTNTASDFGRELDSLADVITFGVAPAVLAWMWGFRLLPPLPYHDARARLVQIGAVATFMFLIAGAARLARFNIQKNPQPSNPGRPGKKYFVGMPIPAGAGVVAATVHFAVGDPLIVWWWSVIWCALIMSCAFLMVSTWRFYSFKDLSFRHRHPFSIVLLIAGMVALIVFFSQYVLFFLALTYMLSGVLSRLAFIVRRRPLPPPTAYAEAPESR
jgi:CDP-diacylglycerol--serine O-phosphatidyltransferase